MIGLYQQGLINNVLRLNNKVVEQTFLVDEITLETLINGLGCVGQIKCVMQLFLIYKGRSNVIYTTLIDYLFRVNSSNETKDLCYEMILSGTKRNVITYTVVVKGLCSMSRLEETCATRNEMQLNGVMPNLHTYIILITGFCKKGRVKDITTLFDMMIRAYLKPGIKI